VNSPEDGTHVEIVGAILGMGAPRLEKGLFFFWRRPRMVTTVTVVTIREGRGMVTRWMVRGASRLTLSIHAVEGGPIDTVLAQRA
jgi:hypothetical protein